jgi:hypothetical protein
MIALALERAGVVGECTTRRWMFPSDPWFTSRCSREGRRRPRYGCHDPHQRGSARPVSCSPPRDRIAGSGVAVSDIQSMQSVIGDSISRTSFTMAILVLAAGIALFLGAVTLCLD